MIIAHDFGTSGNQTSLHDEAGRTLGICTVGYPTHFAPDGVAEQDPDDWWRAVGEATRRLLSEARVDPARIQAVGLSGQMMGAVFLDAAHRPVRPAFIWADQRSIPQTRRLVQAVGQQAAYAQLGHRINATYTLPKAMWVREMEPGLWARTRAVCVAKDYVTVRLTGVLVTDPSDASSTDAYDLNSGAWSSGMLDAAAIPLEVMPEIVPSTTIASGLTAEAAEHTGLKIGTPVVVGGGDGPMASVGVGAITPDDSAYVSLGSSAWVAFSAARPLIDPHMRSFTFEHIVPGYYAPNATIQAGGASLHWVADLLEPGGGTDRFPKLLAEVDTARAASDGLFFLPYLLGERSPHWNPAAAGTFAGLGRHHGRGSVVRAVLEGVAFNLSSCLDGFGENCRTIDSVDVIGGGASSDVWLAAADGQRVGDTGPTPKHHRRGEQPGRRGDCARRRGTGRLLPCPTTIGRDRRIRATPRRERRLRRQARHLCRGLRAA